MTSQQIKDLLKATPFVPFNISVAGEEKSYQIPHPDFAMLTHKGGVLVVALTDRDAAHLISVPLITKIETTPTPA
jgi:hypothetical protein